MKKPTREKAEHVRTFCVSDKRIQLAFDMHRPRAPPPPPFGPAGRGRGRGGRYIQSAAQPPRCPIPSVAPTYRQVRPDHPRVDDEGGDTFQRGTTKSSPPPKSTASPEDSAAIEVEKAKRFLLSVERPQVLNEFFAANKITDPSPNSLAFLVESPSKEISKAEAFPR